MLLGRLRRLPRSILFSTNQLNCGAYRPALVIVFVDVCIPIDGHFYAAHFSTCKCGLLVLELPALSCGNTIFKAQIKRATATRRSGFQPPLSTGIQICSHTSHALRHAPGCRYAVNNSTLGNPTVIGKVTINATRHIKSRIAGGSSESEGARVVFTKH